MLPAERIRKAETNSEGHFQVRRMVRQFLRGMSSLVLLAVVVAEEPRQIPQPSAVSAVDPIFDLQSAAVESGKADFAYWGTDSEKYTGWTSHSNRLIPVYTYGSKGAGDRVDLDSWFGARSVYRSEEALRAIYGYLPDRSLNPDAVWMDQTNIFDIQVAATEAGKKYIFLVVFDGMDWQTTRAAAIWNQAADSYQAGRGAGTHFQTYDADGTSQFGFMVTSPHNDGTDVDVDAQQVQNPGGTMLGGYNAAAGGISPWDEPSDPGYMIGKGTEQNPKHAYTDSSSSATSMTAGIKTFNGGINVEASGERVSTIAHVLQERGWRAGAVSSVPISHATPASAYAHNVSRDDYQDLTRDMLGLPSIQHPQQALPGLDVVIGGGYGTTAESKDGIKKQGTNFIEGNVYLSDEDLAKSDVKNGGRYVAAVRTTDVDGSVTLAAAAKLAAEQNQRLLGFYGQGTYGGHLPFMTANGDHRPAPGNSKKAESYSDADILENPTVAEMTAAAVQVLGRDGKPFWLMVEPGDVDWANHDNNLDNSIGAVNSGDAAVKVITDWVEQHSNWKESLLIVTADHGHMLNLVKPEVLSEAAKQSRQNVASPNPAE